MSSSPILVGNVARPLVGKTALVTGGSRGIGAGIAIAFAAAGADVVIGYSASGAAAEAVVKKIESHGVRGFAIQADQADQAQVAGLVASAVAKLGKLDILVNNAGVAVVGPATEGVAASTDAFAKMWAVNVTSVSTAVRAAAAHLSAGGRIITIGSIASGSSAFPGLADYSATKAALIGYTKGWARDFGAKGVTVNLVQPGAVDTDMNPANGPYAHLTKLSPAGRHGTTEELAAAVLFLASPAASFVNAAILNVDGGHTA